jgi:phage terminase large subunit-like protein
MKPPSQAYEACKDKNQGDSVKITTPWGETIKGVCKQVEGKLAAMPEGGVREPRNSRDR